MATDKASPQLLIQEAFARCTGNVSTVAVRLWRPLALELISIIGEKGFNSLYVRNLYLSHESFPWLPLGDVSGSIDSQIEDLKLGLEGQDTLEADRASRVLLQTFLNLLASLIGEPLMTTILISAWSDNDSERETTGKEFPHE